MIAFCIDCDSSREITVHGQCLACGSYAICYRRVEITKLFISEPLSSLQRDGVMGDAMNRWRIGTRKRSTFRNIVGGF